ncbi:pentatricopeptide repeat-containing protein At5g48910-like [Carica papaya]|uniref:pentatricopeptide repeat-containing protein At5g48910-like n=1 Tax=Carica papaya TaxID=3649 RepID=UPI000B8CBDA5|nr:pentatricopeptide repeat-containing protein At5g48910-like [Carica papaya]
MYAKCGRINLASDVFENMKENELLSWNAMMRELDMHGRAEDAVELFFKIQRERVLRPNGITFVCILNACAHEGWVDKGVKIFNSMQKIYGVEQKMEHYDCVVDLLGKVGLLEKAEELIASMLMKPNAANWKHYAKDRRWEDVEKLRKLMKGRGIRTTPGINMIDLDDIIHEFKMGDGSHPQVKEIHMMLEKIIEKLQMEGYSPSLGASS